LSLSKQIRLSSYEKPNSDPKIVSSCVVSVSNYCWFERTRELAPKLARCANTDFDITFKLSSSVFATARNESDDYHFDRNGVRLSYNQFYSLFRSEKFTKEYLAKVETYFKRDLELKEPTVLMNGANQSDEEFNDDHEDENEPDLEDVPIRPYLPARSQLDKSIKNSVIKRLKKL
jgi:hypothetical protein